MTRFSSLMAALAVGAALLAPSFASAVTTTFTEGGRDPGLGDFHVTSASANDTNPDLNAVAGTSFGVGSSFVFLGRLATSSGPTVDAFQFTFDENFNLFLDNLVAGGPVATLSEVTFSLRDLTTSAIITAVGAVGPVFSNVAAGTYGLTITASDFPSISDYDITVAAVPLPASMGFLLAGLCGLGLVRRRRRKIA